MISRPPPLDLPGSPTPKSTLKLMLEASDRKDRGENPYPSPLSAVDPMALDELLNRIDTEALADLKVPKPEDIEKLVNYYWSQREVFNLEQQLGITNKPKRQKAQSVVTLNQSVLEILQRSQD